MTTRPTLLTARQRLAQRALRQLDTGVTSTTAFHTLSHLMAVDMDHSAASMVSFNGQNNKNLAGVSSKQTSLVSLIKKYGFSVELDQMTPDEFLTSTASLFKEPDDLRTLSVVVAESDQYFFVNRDYLCAWSEQFREFSDYSLPNNLSNNNSTNECSRSNSTASSSSSSSKLDDSPPLPIVNDSKRSRHEEFHFPGSESQFQLLLNVVWPLAKRFSINHVVDVLKLCNQWVIHEAVADVAAYYLHNCMQVGSTDKLKLVSQSGNMLLLYGCLNYQCNRETIFELVNQNPDEYAQVRKGAYASMTIAKMLEHAAGDNDSDYKDALNCHLSRELNAFKRRLSESTMTFGDCWSLFSGYSPPGRRISSVANSRCIEVYPSMINEFVCFKNDGAAYHNVKDDQNSQQNQHSLFVDKNYLAVWSPVFYQMFYSDFRDRARSRLPLGVDKTSPRALRLFLALLHPTRACVALKILPREYTRSGRANHWLDDLYQCIFENDAELLMDVFKLAHQYQVSYLVDACLVFVETKCEFSIGDKFLMADAYHLPTLMVVCISKLTTPLAIKQMVIENEKFLENLSNQAHRLLTDRLLALL